MTLDEIVAMRDELARYRQQIAAISEAIARCEESLAEHPQYNELMRLRGMLSEVKKQAVAVEDRLRSDALSYYIETGELSVNGLSVRHTYEAHVYDDNEVLNWCFVNLRAALRIDTDLLLQALKSGPVPGAELIRVPKVVVARELERNG